MNARGTWNTPQGIRNSSYYLTLESSTWNPEPMAWNPEVKTVLDFLACSDNSVLGAPNDFFFSTYCSKSKYYLEVSNVREKLSISGYWYVLSQYFYPQHI